MFPRNKPNKIHIKAEEIRTLLNDNILLIIIEIITKVATKINPKIFCLIKFMSNLLLKCLIFLTYINNFFKYFYKLIIIIKYFYKSQSKLSNLV